MRDLILYVLPVAVALTVILLILANHYLREVDDYQRTPQPAQPAHARPSEPRPAAARVRRTGPAYPDPGYQAAAGWHLGNRDRLDGIPAQLAAAATRAQHLTDRRVYNGHIYAELAPDALEPCDLCGRVGLHTFSEWAREHSAWMAQQVAEASRFAGQHGLVTAWCGDYALADAA